VSRWLPPLAVSLIALLVGIGAGLQHQKPKEQINLERIAKSDPRIEFVARAICRARGLDPDHDAPPYPGPLWESFILEARDLIAADDAVDLWLTRHPGRQGPPD